MADATDSKSIQPIWPTLRTDKSSRRKQLVSMRLQCDKIRAAPIILAKGNETPTDTITDASFSAK
jgi:hypothetical protein